MNILEFCYLNVIAKRSILVMIYAAKNSHLCWSY